MGAHLSLRLDTTKSLQSVAGKTEHSTRVTFVNYAFQDTCIAENGFLIYLRASLESLMLVMSNIVLQVVEGQAVRAG